MYAPTAAGVELVRWVRASEKITSSRPSVATASASRCAEDARCLVEMLTAAVGAYIGAAYFFTSSTSFANPAIAVGRMFSDTFAGIAPASVPGFVLAELAGGILAIVVLRTLYPDVTPEDAAEVVIPHSDGSPRSPRLAQASANTGDR